MGKLKITCPWIVAEMRREKAAMNRWYVFGLHDTVGEPGWTAKTYGMLEKVRKAGEAKILYAAALAKKRGLLPVNAAGWTAVVTETGVLFQTNAGGTGEDVFVPLNLTPAVAAVEFKEAA